MTATENPARWGSGGHFEIDPAGELIDFDNSKSLPHTQAPQRISGYVLDRFLVFVEVRIHG